MIGRGVVASAAWAGSVAAFAASTPTQTVRAYDVYGTPGRMVRLAEGRRLNLRCGGRGSVTVLLEAGLAYPSYSWRKVQPALERVTRTCSYDRAGLGFSDAGPLPRSAAAIADDLEQLIDRAGLTGPLVLVASSAGSQSTRLLAFRRPDRIAGMVMLDPFVEGQNAALDAISPPDPTDRARERGIERDCDRLLGARLLDVAHARARGCIDAPDPAFSARLRMVTQAQRLSPRMAAASASERDMLEGRSSDEVRAATRPLGAIPVLVLTAGDNFTGGPKEAALTAELRRLHRSIAALSTSGEERIVPGAGHVIQSSRPDAVIAAVTRMVRAVTARPRR